MRMASWHRVMVFGAIAIALGSAPVFADPPARVGRISYIENTVSFRPNDQDQWSLATLNYPVTSGDSLWTEPDARGEIEIGSIDVRMDHATEVDVVDLDDNTTRLEVPQGAINVHLTAKPLGGAVEIMTPAGQVDLLEAGTYHIDSGQPNGELPSNQVQATTLEGKMQVHGDQQLLEVMQGEMAQMTADPPSFTLQEGNATAFDDWALSREKREVASQSLHYVSPHMTGYEDLDRYGEWTQEPDYGAVWYPASVAPDWAPYRYGHWAYVAPWGWTWVDDAPWGFAPFHYGRWAHIHNRWGWTPGVVVERPVYAPALVAFIGGSGWSLSITDSEPVGWVPLAPYEVYQPYYPASVRYVRNVNITNVNRTVINHITVNDIRHNRNFANRDAATVVPARAFTRREEVHQARIDVARQQLEGAPLRRNLNLQPERIARANAPLPPSERFGWHGHNIRTIVQTRSLNPSAPLTRGENADRRASINNERNVNERDANGRQWVRGPAPHAATATQETAADRRAIINNERNIDERSGRRFQSLAPAAGSTTTEDNNNNRQDTTTDQHNRRENRAVNADRRAAANDRRAENVAPAPHAVSNDAQPNEQPVVNQPNRMSSAERRAAINNERRTEGNTTQVRREPAPRREAVVMGGRHFTPAAQAQRMERANVARPQQNTEITATPKGWQRQQHADRRAAVNNERHVDERRGQGDQDNRRDNK